MQQCTYILYHNAVALFRIKKLLITVILLYKCYSQELRALRAI